MSMACWAGWVFLGLALGRFAVVVIDKLWS